MTSRFMLIVAAISGFIYVALGAFGAHVLSKKPWAWLEMGLDSDRPAISGVPYAGDLWPGGGDAAPYQHLVLLEQRFSGAGHGAVLAAVCTALRFRICACGRISRLSAASVSWWAGRYY